MRFFRRIAGLLGLARDDGGQETKNQQEGSSGGGEGDQNRQNHGQPQFHQKFQDSGLPRKGFSVPVQVAVERPHLGPILVPCSSGDGGVQGLRWYGKRLRIDEDGDVADEFIDEVLPEAWNHDDHQKPMPRFKMKYETRPAKVTRQAMSQDGKVRQCVEYQGRLQWV
ncbi:hypothetical protein K2173_016928 [Erythroxylum novogranatense]|uniref:Uncharacterized protein n=1 Tax=Erythroxylum novogranatense TaxID=1862640 RepID=A0AAV8U589_9ROSI|nr:hypothetical protein K2173_016928 [Erythroxylum novogranatense]